LASKNRSMWEEIWKKEDEEKGSEVCGLEVK
jgi:hypothetical protein